MDNNQKKAVVYGLVLSGGRSTRMGMDKGNISYHDKPQKEYLYDLLKPLCQNVYLSIRTDQETDIKNGLDYIVDMDLYKGPFNGLLSAHLSYPEVAWLVLACDMPLIGEETLRSLLRGRDHTAVATALATRETGLPEPLAAIWEPRGLALAIESLKDAASSCPRKFLLNNKVGLVYAASDESLYNANSMEDYKEAKARLSGA